MSRCRHSAMSGSEDHDEEVTQLPRKDGVDVLYVRNEASNMETDEDSNDESGSNWPDNTTMKLIEMWRERDVLYDTSHKHYRNKMKKEKALNQISTELNMTRMYLWVIKCRRPNDYLFGSACVKQYFILNMLLGIDKL